MADTYATSFGVLNYSGLLFNKGNTATPFSTLIGGHPKVTNSVEFVTGQEYTSGGGTQPAISESASLTAPDATVVTRTQKTNVTQIFQESVAISYAKQSNMGTLSGLNAAGQTANPINELDFQVARKMEKIAADIEYTFLNGAYNKATTDATINKTRGMATAITTNTIAKGGDTLTYQDLCDMLQKIADGNAPTDGLVLLANSVTIRQINNDAIKNGMTSIPDSREINGLNIKEIVTPFGNIGLLRCQRLASGTALVVNPNVIAPVHQMVPEKGNFFLEPLAKTGAGEKYQIFGQLGLDHGPEWYHGKFTGICTTVEKAKESGGGQQGG